MRAVVRGARGDEGVAGGIERLLDREPGVAQGGVPQGIRQLREVRKPRERGRHALDLAEILRGERGVIRRCGVGGALLRGGVAAARFPRIFCTGSPGRRPPGGVTRVSVADRPTRIGAGCGCGFPARPLSGDERGQ